MASTSYPRPNRAREGFEDNPTIFGQILRGELPAEILFEDERVLCFRDIRPVSKHHALVIPKHHVPDSNHLTAADEEIVRHMEAVALQAVRIDFPQLDAEAALQAHDLSLGFHRWPMLSVHHLHLHCIYPMPAASWWFRFLHPQQYGFFYRPSAQFPPGPSP
jgi:histidine triad (HIT) family protein